MPIVSMTRRKSPVWSGWGSMSVCMWEGGRLGCRCVIFASRLVPILFGYLGFLAFQLKVFCLEDRQQHFLGKGRDCQALGEGMTCLKPLSSHPRSSGCSSHLLRLRPCPGASLGPTAHPELGEQGMGLARGDPSPRVGNVLAFGMFSMHPCCCYLDGALLLHTDTGKSLTSTLGAFFYIKYHT